MIRQPPEPVSKPTVGSQISEPFPNARQIPEGLAGQGAR
jgi:hypothetical protein